MIMIKTVQDTSLVYGSNTKISGWQLLARINACSQTDACDDQCLIEQSTLGDGCMQVDIVIGACRLQ